MAFDKTVRSSGLSSTEVLLLGFLAAIAVIGLGKFGLSVVAIRRGEDITARTGPETVIPQDCSLFIIADRRDLARLLG